MFENASNKSRYEYLYARQRNRCPNENISFVFRGIYSITVHGELKKNRVFLVLTDKRVPVETTSKAEEIYDDYARILFFCV